MFTQIDASVWRIAAQIETGRRRRLLDAPCYDNIVNALSKDIANISLRREPCSDDIGYFRVVAVVQYARAEPVDTFHNSCSGYRAQFLASPETGELANTLAASVLNELAMSRLRKRFPPRWDREWAETSLRHSSIKAWIHQGLWLRQAKEACEELVVDAWSEARTYNNPEVRRRARYGRQLPGDERKIDLKGAWVTPGLIVRATFKPCRALSIHRCGFT